MKQLFVFGMLAFALIGRAATEGPYEIQKNEMTKFLPNDLPCPYFFLTDSGYLKSPQPRFKYIIKDGKETDDSVVPGAGEIKIDEKKIVPTAESSIGANGKTFWTLRMSKSVYDENKLCLGSVPLK
jgi:hypothetical protein